MNIIVIIPRKFAGCGFYRQYQPYNHIAKNYPVKVLITDGLPMDDSDLKKYDIAIWHKSFFEINDIKRAKNNGLKTIVDFDDFWILQATHSLHKDYLKSNTVGKLHRLILTADVITCTTDRLAFEISKHNINVHVLPNAMDMNYPGCNVNRVQDQNYIFGYLGGHCHVRDVSLCTPLNSDTSLT